MCLCFRMRDMRSMQRLCLYGTLHVEDTFHCEFIAQACWLLDEDELRDDEDDLNYFYDFCCSSLILYAVSCVLSSSSAHFNHLKWLRNEMKAACL